MSDQVFYKHADAVQYCASQDVDKTLIEKHSEIDSIYELVRARDLNAFLWFIIHKAKFLNVSTLNSNKCILKTIEGKDNNNSISIGEPFEQMDGSNKYAVMGLCIKYKANDSNDGETRESATPNSGKDVSNTDVGNSINSNDEDENEYTIVPTTNIWNGCNWYVDRSRYFDFYNKKKEFMIMSLLYFVFLC
jgi:hypothetical protein